MNAFPTDIPAFVRHAVRCLAVMTILGSLSMVAQELPGGFDVRAYHQSKGAMASTDFYRTFPFDEYIERSDLTDFDRIESDRLYFWKTFGDGDQFLYLLMDYFVLNNPVRTIDDAGARLAMAEEYLDEKRTFLATEERKNPQHAKINAIYLVIGHFLMANVGHWIGEELKAGRIAKDQPNIASIIERMKKHKVLVEMPETFTEKIATRPAAQVANRAIGFVELYRPFFTFGPIFVGLVFFAIAFRWLRAFWIPSGCLAVLAGLVAFMLVPAPLETSSQVDGPKPESHPANLNSNRPPPLRPSAVTWVECPDQNNFGFTADHGVKLNEIKGKEDQRVLGHSLSLDAERFRIEYYVRHTATVSLADWISRIQQSGELVVVTSGGYSNSLDQPEGLTFENGILINAVLLHDRKALVRIENGKLDVSNLKNLNPTEAELRTAKSNDDSFVSLAVYEKLTTSLRDQKTTSFQTHLLADDNRLLIDARKADTKLAERRMLAILESPQGKRSYNLLNISAKINLATAATEIVAYFQNNGLTVRSLINLDTGKYDTLRVFGRDGQPFSNSDGEVIRGTKELDTATNLLAFYIPY